MAKPNAAIEWARHAFPFDTFELISQATWATTYRLVKGSDAAYLKVLPKQSAAAVAWTQRLSQRFVAQVPQVLASDKRRGWLLSLAHGGRTLEYDSPDKDLDLMIQSYARLQAQAAQDHDLLAALPPVDLDSLPQKLLDFLQPGPDYDKVAPTAPVQADYFLGRSGAAHARRLLAGCLGLLQQHLQAAQALPRTVTHGDLRPPNAALKDSADCVLMDWDDAMAGPAGFSLHGMFSGCARATVLLSGSATARAAAATPAARSLRTYVNTLVKTGYASRAALLKALPGSMCAGMIQFMLNFAKFPGDSSRYDVQDTLQSRLTDLLDLCDLLASRDPAVAHERAALYEAGGDWRRALALLQDLVAHNPTQVPLLLRMAQACRQQKQADMAEELLREAVRLSPRAQGAQPLTLLGELLLERLNLPEARKMFKRALRSEPGHAGAQTALARVSAIEAMRKAAALPRQAPILRCEPGDAQAGIERPEFAALGAELFNTYGMLQIDNAFPLELIERLQSVFFERYSAYFQDDHHPDALHVGDKRYMLTVDMDAPFNDPQLLGASTVLPIIRKLLGDECVLGAFTAVISLPGSRDQRIHKDHPALFPDTPWHFNIPPFSAQIIIPLIPLDEFSGTTRFYKGSHKVLTTQSEALGHQDAMVPMGSCLLNDYRCAHRGLANRSDKVRPILTLIFNRPWFRDYANYGKQPPLRLRPEAFEALDENIKPLVAWWTEEVSVVKLDQAALR